MTVIRRTFDPQTRRLTDTTNSGACGGTVLDVNMLTIHITVPAEFATYHAYTVFDVTDAAGGHAAVDCAIVPSSGLVTVKVPYSVISRVRGNRLTYQLILTTGHVLAASDADTVVMSDRDDLLICRTFLGAGEIRTLVDLISSGGDGGA